MSPRSAKAKVIAGLKCAEISPRKYTAATSQRADTVESTKAASHARTGPPPYRTRMAAPPDSTKVSPDTPINSERSRRSLWSGLVQSAKYRGPPTVAMSACSPCGTGVESELVCAVLVITASLPQWLAARVAPHATLFSSRSVWRHHAAPARTSRRLLRQCTSLGRRRGCGCRHIGPHHFLWIDDAIEFGLRDVAQFQSGRLQRQIVVHGVVSDLRRFVVADHRRERRDQHERALHIFVDLFQIGLGALDQEPAEIRAAVRHDRYRVGNVEDNQRLIDVHFKIAAGATEADRDVIGHHLHRDHRRRFALGRVDLARHDRGARLVFRYRQFRKSGTRAAGHQPDVIADLVQRYRERAER